ncbi:fungal-specific transcription factor domain-containing protein [Aspergillus karnatakaensis]|uniref:Zn(II)2Cys6 transcription factor n=1 Tax=Aspergillus karnatakaensis TaxID=1810916 RepID=UPI003CCDE430
MPPRSSTSSKQSRKHVTTACNPCREGKVKCDGVTPVCDHCRAKGKRCSYRSADDKRKIPLRNSIGLLVQRINELSRYIRSNGLEVPQMEENDLVTIKGIFEAAEVDFEGDVGYGRRRSSEPHISPGSITYGGLRDAAVSQNPDIGGVTGQPDIAVGLQTPLTGTASEEAANVEDLLPAIGTSGMSIATSLEHPHNTRFQEPSQINPHASSPDIASALLELADVGLYQNRVPIESCIEDAQQANNHYEDDEDDEDEVANQLSCRLGKLQVTHDGQLRYFGSTSNFTLLDILVDVGPSSSSSNHRRTQDILENAGLGLRVDESFRKHLLQLYFTWHDPCLHAVDEEIFWTARTQNRLDGMDTPYFSDALSDAMCAIGATYESKYHPELVTFPRSLGEFFSDRAKILLEAELENPSLATIHTLVILSSYEASCTRDTRGWLYSGMAMRLAFDLGLHLDMTPYVAKGIIPYTNYEVRRTTFWAVYMSEQFWAYYLGRPTRSPMEGVTVPKPDANSPHPPSKWNQYGSPHLYRNMTNLPNPLGLICHQQVSLYDCILPLTDILYGRAEISKPQLQKLTADTVEKLRHWKGALPPELQIHDQADLVQPAPHVLALHMQYHQLMIHCHRPYISRHHIQPKPPQGPGSSHARMMCVESAIAIARALASYERYYSFRRANSHIVSYIFSAALILIFAIVPSTQYNDDQELVGHLSTCFRALDEMGSQFENAKRTSTFLTALQREWQAKRRSKMARGVKRKFPEGQRERDNRVAAQAQDYYGSAAGDRFWSDGGRPSIDSVMDGYLYSVDFMEPDLCNILLSEGIPRAFV